MDSSHQVRDKLKKKGKKTRFNEQEVRQKPNREWLPSISAIVTTLLAPERTDNPLQESF